MVMTATKQSAGPCHLTYVLLNAVPGALVVANSVLLADMVPGPLHDAWNSTYANQAAMRLALLGALGGINRQGCYAVIQLQVAGKDTTAEVNQVQADVDADAVTATKAELNLLMSTSDTTQRAMLHLIAFHSITE